MKLSAVPLVTVITGLAALLAAMLDLITKLGLSPRAADSMLASMFGTLAASWLVLSWKESVQHRSIGLTASMESGTITDRAKKAAPQMVVATVFAVLAVRYALPAISSFLEAPWEICTTVVSPCGKDYCARFVDNSGRPTFGQCVRSIDGSGLLRVSSDKASGYKPTSILLECPNKPISNPMPIQKEAFDRTCSSLLEVP